MKNKTYLPFYCQTQTASKFYGHSNPKNRQKYGYASAVLHTTKAPQASKMIKKDAGKMVEVTQSSMPLLKQAG